MKIKNLAIALLSAVLLSSCSSNSEAEVSGTSQVQFKLVDAPGDYEEVNVEIIDIQYNNSEDDLGWRSFTSFSGPINVDLTTLIAGNSVILSDEVIEAGMLKQVRLILGTNNTLLLEGESTVRALNTPSAQQSGLKLQLNENLEAGFTYSFILDWDVQQSIVATGSGNYNLKPVIRVNAEKNSGSISGQVFQDNSTSETSDDTPLQDAVVSVYTTSNVLVTETFTNAEGRFIVQGLPEGNYIVKITKNGFIDFTTAASVNVTVGSVVNLDSILLLTI